MTFKYDINKYLCGEYFLVDYSLKYVGTIDFENNMYVLMVTEW